MGLSATVTRFRPGTLRRSPHRPRRRSVTRALSGVLVGGLVALALLLVAGWWYAERTGFPGPGHGMLAGHLAAAVAAVIAQVWVDRRRDAVGTLVSLVLSAAVVGGLTAVWLF